MDINKKYIVWINYGCEGWHPKECATLEEALDVSSYGSEKVITKRCSFTIIETDEA